MSLFAIIVGLAAIAVSAVNLFYIRRAERDLETLERLVERRALTVVGEAAPALVSFRRGWSVNPGTDEPPDGVGA